MTEALQQEIRTLRSILDSERDPGGRVFAPLADAYRRAGRVPEALRLLNEGLAKHPDFVTGHVVAAQLYVEQGLGAEGQLAARRALELDDENVLALGALLRVLDESGDAEAEEVRARLTVLEPDFAEQAAPASEPTPTSGREVHEEPSTPDAPTVPLRALEALAPFAGTAPKPFELEAPPAEPPVPSGAIDLTMMSIPAAALPLSALAPEPEPPVMERAFEMPVFGADVAPAEELVSLDALAPAFEEPVMNVAALAPEPAFEEPVMDLASLAPEPAFEEPVMDLASLAPEPAFEEPVMDLASLAPEPAFEEPVMDLASLAPEPAFEEPVMDLASLAPDSADEEPVMDLASLAPEPADEEPVMDLAALAPEPAVEEPVMDLAALAPEPAVEEPVMDLAALAPEPAVEEPVMDLAALAPEPAVEEEVVSLASLAPASETIIDMDELAPSPAPPPKVTVAPRVQDMLGFDEPIFDLDTLAPAVAGRAPEPPAAAPAHVVEEAVVAAEDIVIDLDALRPDGPASAPLAASDVVASVPYTQPIAPGPTAEAPDPDEASEPDPETELAAPPEDQGAPVYTRTLAELYAAQGAAKQAVEVLRHLMAQNPSDQELSRRVAELEAGAAQAPVDRDPVRQKQEEEEEEVETLARDLAESGAIHEVESPFAWTEKESEATAEVTGPTIREYFDGLLGWEPREDS